MAMVRKQGREPLRAEQRTLSGIVLLGAVLESNQYQTLVAARKH